MIEKPQIKTRVEVDKFLSDINVKKESSKNKLLQLNNEKTIKENELKELNVELVKCELDGNSAQYNKINKKILEYRDILKDIDSKIYAYTQYSEFHSIEADEIFLNAAYEYNEIKDKFTNDLNKKLVKVSDEIDKLNDKIKELKEEKEDILYSLYTAKPFEGIGYSIYKIFPYLDKDTKEGIEKMIESEKVMIKGEEGKVVNKFLRENYNNIKKNKKEKLSILNKIFGKNN